MAGELISLKIKCGGCEQEVEIRDALYIDAGQCTCYPDTYTCMCDLSKKIEALCPSCKYFNSIEIY